MGRVVSPTPTPLSSGRVVPALVASYDMHGRAVGLFYTQPTGHLVGCFTGVNRGCLAPEYILSIALVSLRWISGEKIDIPLLGSVAGGEWMK